MGESIFIEPIRRWVNRYFMSGKTPLNDQIAFIRGVFEGTDVSARISQPANDAADEDLNELPPDLVEEVFQSQAPRAQRQVESNEPVQATRPLIRVSADGDPEDVDPDQTQQSTVTSASAGVSQDPAATVESASTVVADRPANETAASTEPSQGVSQPANQTVPTDTDQSGSDLDFLKGDLTDLFRATVISNPHTKHLIEKHGTVAADELVDDLRDLGRSIGESGSRRPRRPRP